MSVMMNGSTAGEVATELIGRDYLSHSSINCYRTCPLQFYFRYIERLPEEIVSASLVFGSAIHTAVQLHYEELLAGNPAPDVDTLLFVYQEAWRRQDAEIQFAKDQDADSMGRLAERVLVAFAASDLAKPNGKIIGIEEELRGELVADCPELLARVDLIVQESDAVVIRDFKTSRSRWSTTNVESSAEQLMLYGELAKPLSGTKPLRLEFAVLTKTKEPAVEVHSVKADPTRIERTKQTVQRVWRAIESGHFYPAPSPLACSTCPFQQPCRAWSG